jgi:hypothetical protein
MRLLLNIYIIFFSIASFGQIWDYPPASYSYQEVLSEDQISISQIISFKYEIKNGKETGKKELEKSREYDNHGNLILEIFGSGDSTVYGNYESGYWGFKIIAHQDTIFQRVIFDSDGKDIYNATFNCNVTNDTLITISQYDSQGNITLRTTSAGKITWIYNEGKDTLVKEFAAARQTWEYLNQKIFKYSKFDNNIPVETRTFRHHDNTIAYVTTYHSFGKSYTDLDSTLGIFNENEEVIKVLSYISGEETTEMKCTYDEKGRKVKLFHGCSKFLYDYNENGWLIRTESYNCEGELIGLSRTEYFVKN